MVVDGSSILLEDSIDLGIVARQQMMCDLTGWEPPLDCFCGIRRILISKLAAYVKELDDITDDTPEIEVWAWERIIPLQPVPHPLGANHYETSALLAEHVVQREYQHMADRHEALAMGHEIIYRMAQLILRDSRATSEMYEFASEVARISSESMNSAYLGTRLSFAPNHAPLTQSAKSPPVQVRCQGCQSAFRDSTRQGRRGGPRADSMANRSKEPHDNFGLSLATTIEAYYPTFEFGEPSTPVTNFSREETVGFVTPPVVQYDFAQLSKFHHALQLEMREFFMNKS
ncbi:hypothetical protein P3S67_025914 [Capsicum chacoense]